MPAIKIDYTQKIQAIRTEINRGFKEDEESPLAPKERASFSGLDFFPIDENYKFICAISQKSESGDEIQLETSKGKMRVFINYGKVEFTIQNSPCQLDVYKVADHEYYFTPFMDSTCGKESYGGGRYVTLEKLKDGNFVLDFNLAYNPSCAYSDKYDCVMVPFENRLSVPINAGVKKYH